MQLYNSLTRKIEEFTALKPPQVGIYTCGPTVYQYATIGNFRTYLTTDMLVRTLKAFGYEPHAVMNLTDVGHLTGDNLGDSSTGEDRIERAAKKEAKSAYDIANFYSDAFLKDYNLFNLLPQERIVRATDHIPEQIALVQALEAKGYTYRTSDGIYFDTDKFPGYGTLSTIDQAKEGARVEANPEKKNPRDFALWKFSSPDEKRQMEWNSPWGVGFPGWHIECSAMSMKYLGDTFDIHTGGEDLRSTHHPNEIAQAEAVTGKPFVRYWVHSAFLMVDGKKMSKSLGNLYLLSDIIYKGFDPMVLKYLYYSTHYRVQSNFTWEALSAAKTAYDRLAGFVQRHADEPQCPGDAKYRKKFLDALADDLNMPRALSQLWELLKDESVSNGVKLATVFSFDEVLGFELEAKYRILAALSPEIQSLADERKHAREAKDWLRSDVLRVEIEAKGYKVEDAAEVQRILKKADSR